jgi:hypothetical protein
MIMRNEEFCFDKVLRAWPADVTCTHALVDSGGRMTNRSLAG